MSVNLKCFVGYKNLTAFKRSEICNGAGAKNDWRSNFIPNTLWGLDCTEVFNIHDHCYYVGLSRADKEASDSMMLINLLRLIKNGSKILAPLRRRRALLYFEAVDIAGGDAFWSGKEIPKKNTQPKNIVQFEYYD